MDSAVPMRGLDVVNICVVVMEILEMKFTKPCPFKLMMSDVQKEDWQFITSATVKVILPVSREEISPSKSTLGLVTA